jgi:hypothetical protein
MKKHIAGKTTPRLSKQLRNQPFLSSPPTPDQITRKCHYENVSGFFSVIYLVHDPVNLSPGFLFLPTHGASRATLGSAPPLLFFRSLPLSCYCSSPDRCSSPTVPGRALPHVARSSSPAPRRLAPASTKEHHRPSPARVPPQASLLYEGSSFFP